MSGERRDQPEQEISIRRRGHELFVEEPTGPAGPAKPFSEYLRETPATPLSGGVKAGLWAVALVAALLFAAAVWRLINPPRPAPRRPRAGSASRRADETPRATPTVAARPTTPPNQEIRR